MEQSERPRWGLSPSRLRFSWLIVLLLLVALQGSRIAPEFSYERARESFVKGDLEQAQSRSAREYRYFKTRNSTWASKFRLLEAEAMLQRGMSGDALQLLNDLHPDPAHPDLLVQKLAIDSVAFVHRQEFKRAEQNLNQCRTICEAADYRSCGEALQAEGLLSAGQENFKEARSLFLATHKFAQSHRDNYLDASAELNLGWLSLQMDMPEEALSWLSGALRVSRSIGAEDLAEKSSGNLGWAYFKLGDAERALTLFQESERSASRRGNIRSDLGWNSTIGSAYRSIGELDQAAPYFRRALYLAGQIHSREDSINSLEDLTHLSIDQGNLSEANRYLEELERQLAPSASRLDTVYVKLAKGRIAAAGRQPKAEELLRDVENAPDSLISMRLDAEYELAKFYEAKGDAVGAIRAYEKALHTYGSARATLKSDETELAFGANASRIYDGYIHLLMEQGRSEEALATADESRAGTLEKGLDVPDTGSKEITRLNPQRIARRVDAALLFYWLGDKQSYLWAITQNRIAAFTLPPRQEIAGHVKSYTQKILALRDPQRTGDRDGEELYRSLIAPAAVQIEPAKRVIVLADGELSGLNFETLLAPDRKSASRNSGTGVHYLIDDLTLASAPSLSMLEAHVPAHGRGGKMLLLGDPVSPGGEFPSLPLFGFEMSKIESHFAKDELAVFAGKKATPASYLDSKPAQYSYIHFVSHAVANRIVPLDSAIVLSKDSAEENSFKLYARDIIEHPIDAKLVTISACYTSGTRYYAGEGMVGLSWAFLRAGAQRVIGALWEVSDESTPRLMDGLYRNIETGNTPAASLRKAKLALLHSPGRFSLPFYWATFQIYDRR